MTPKHYSKAIAVGISTIEDAPANYRAAQFGIFEDSLPAAVALLFGIDRLRAESAVTIDSIIDDLVARSLLRRNGAQIHLA